MQLAFETTKNLGDHKRHLTGNKPNLSVFVSSWAKQVHKTKDKPTCFP